jgi:hypothetical protein
MPDLEVRHDAPDHALLDRLCELLVRVRLTHGAGHEVGGVAVQEEGEARHCHHEDEEEPGHEARHPGRGTGDERHDGHDDGYAEQLEPRPADEPSEALGLSPQGALRVRRGSTLHGQTGPSSSARTSCPNGM